MLFMNGAIPYWFVFLVDKLIDIEVGEDMGSKVTRFANYLRIVFPGNDPNITAMAAKCLGTR